MLFWLLLKKKVFIYRSLCRILSFSVYSVECMVINLHLLEADDYSKVLKNVPVKRKALLQNNVFMAIGLVGQISGSL